MTDAGIAASVPATVDNPEAWSEIAGEIEQRTGQAPVADLNSLTTFVAESVQLLIDADNVHNADALRAHFSPQVVAQLLHFSGNLAGCTAKGVDLHLIGAPVSQGDPVVRVRAQLTVSEPSHELSRREQFWDIALRTDVAPAPTTCPNCGAPLARGALVCTYCRFNTTAPGESPLFVVKLQRIS